MDLLKDTHSVNHRFTSSQLDFEEDINELLTGAFAEVFPELNLEGGMDLELLDLAFDSFVYLASVEEKYSIFIVEMTTLSCLHP